MGHPPFLWTTCQHGAEPWLKADMARAHPDFRFAFSRPGLVTFKSVRPVSPEFKPQTPFARAYGTSVGPVKDVAEVIAGIDTLGLPHGLCLHVFERDTFRPGEPPADFGQLAASIRAELIAAGGARFRPEPEARLGETVIDVIVGEAPWLLGYHVHARGRSGLPGGRYVVDVPAAAPPKGYRKLQETLFWSGLTPRGGEVAVELGASPGGSSFLLLQRGMKVYGIDPEPVDPAMAEFGKSFVHLRQPMASVTRSQLPQDVHWILIDANVAPTVAIRTVRRMVLAYQKSLHNVIMTLKLRDDMTVDQLHEMIEQIRGWTGAKVEVTQLPSHRQEVVVVVRMGRGPTPEPKEEGNTRAPRKTYKGGPKAAPGKAPVKAGKSAPSKVAPKRGTRSGKGTSPSSQGKKKGN